MRTEDEQGPFLTRLTNLPIVNSAVDQATEMYERTKESNRFLKYTLQTAEAGVKTVASTAKPVVQKLEQPMNKLNTFACDQLDKLEQNYPIITQPTEQVCEQTKQLYDVKLKPAVDKMGHMKTYTTDTLHGVKNFTTVKIDGIKTYTTGTIDGVKRYTNGAIEGVKTSTNNTIQGVKGYTTNAVQGVRSYTKDSVDGAKSYGLGKLSVVRDYSSNKMIVVLDSPYGKTLTETFDKLLKATEDLVDYYLPGEEEPEKEVHCKNEPETLNRLSRLSTKTRGRIYACAMAQLQQLQFRSKEAIGKLTHTVDLIDYAKTNIDSIRGRAKDTLTNTSDRLRYYWEEINRPEDDDNEANTKGEDSKEDNDHKTFSRAFERRLLASARRLTLQVKRGVHAVATHLPALPPQIKDQVTHTKNFVDELYNKLTAATNLSDLPKHLLDQTKETLGRVQKTISFAADYIKNFWALSWLVTQKPSQDKALDSSESPQPQQNDVSGCKEQQLAES